MKEIFDLRRFGKYFTSDLRSCAANYGLSMAMISFMIVIIYIGSVIFSLLIDDSWSGPALGERFFVFCVSMFVLVATMPVKCYGKLTEKRVGSEWLMIPASSFEKFLSMVIITMLVVPLLTAGVFCGLDALICALDPTCGECLLTQIPQLTEGLGRGMTPLICLNQLFAFSLEFLLGAIFFKSGKTSKTLLVNFIIGILFLTVALYISFKGTTTVDVMNESQLNDFIDKTFVNRTLSVIISSVVTFSLLLTGIFVRIKTLKH